MEETNMRLFKYVLKILWGMLEAGMGVMYLINAIQDLMDTKYE